MVSIVSCDIASVEKSSFTPSVNYKRREVSAKRDFPQNCGRNAPRISRLPPNVVLCCSNRENPTDNLQNCPVVNVNQIPEKECVASPEKNISERQRRSAACIPAKSSELGISFEVVDNLNTETDNVFKEPLSFKQCGSSLELGCFEVTESSGHVHQHYLANNLISITTESPEILNSVEATKLNENLSPKVFNLVEASEPIKNVESMVSNTLLPLDITELPRNQNASFIDPKLQKVDDVFSNKKSHDYVSVENSKTETSDVLALAPVESSGCLVECGTFEVVENSVPIGSPQVLKVLIPEATNALEVVDQLEEPELMKVPLIVDILKSSSEKGFINPTKEDELESTGLLRNLNKSDETYSKSLLKNDTHADKKELTMGSTQLPVDSVLPDTLVQLKVLDQPQTSDSGQTVDGCSHNIYPHCRRVSAIRDFPLRCALNTQCSITKANSFRDTWMHNEKTTAQDMGLQIVGDAAKKKMDNVEDEATSHWNDMSMTSKRTGNKAEVKFPGAEEKQMVEHVRIKEGFESKLKQEDITHTNFQTPYKDEIHQSDLNSTCSSKSVDREGQSSQEKLGVESVKVHQETGSMDKHDDCEAGITFNNIKETLTLVQTSQNMDLSLMPLCPCPFVDNDNNNEAVVTRIRVRETLRLFQGVVRKLTQDAESKAKNVQSNGSGRVDLLSAKILKKKHKWVNTGKPILGDVPGVEVGDEFHYRVELAIVGLHRPFQNGIDYVKRNDKIVATSVVSSGGYADVIDSSDVLVYSGQGGNPTGVNKKAEDQKLLRGNLALKNSIDERTPVRVIRGFKESKGNDSPDTRGKAVLTYTYDGLYLVESYWEEKGCYGTNVFKFQLRRIPGQPELPIKEVKKSKKSRVREGLCVIDITQGKEKMRISAINTVDEERPPSFDYVSRMIYPSWYNLPFPEGCECIDGCSNSEKCVCTIKNAGDIPYNHDGAIVEAKTVVYECGPLCKCPPSCHNRVSQHGIKFKLEIFKTKSRGWGVRSLNSISSGSFICEYTGELLQDQEAEKRTSNDEYLFDIGHSYGNHAVSDDVSNMVPFNSKSSFPSEVVQEEGFTIDAAFCGSVARFINHSCSPNLYAQNVLFDHGDKRMPHIMLFAMENIPPLQELTYHYNYELDQVHDADGNIKKKNCYCGSPECIGRMY